MKYEIVNLETWKRRKLFRFYIENLRNVMSMTVDIDVTALIEFVHAHGLKFYPTMMWVVSKAINQREEFKYGWDKEGKLTLLEWFIQVSVSISYVFTISTVIQQVIE